ncbi:hypothetical protein CES85_0316 [Ochrobactrum quorumnocens]|uniref:Uncharacterized protein n=1 Tax=Ochrobactrum quorumnocens TaxID=271865 RepID=A0A248UHS0_9HYPH|nr:hypothetical protein CES85_0316 [[Ochrobactrum] quorumnocens]
MEQLPTKWEAVAGCKGDFFNHRPFPLTQSSTVCGSAEPQFVILND